MNFYKDVEIAEVRQFYSMQVLIEAVHAETYSLLIDTYISDKTEKESLFNAIETIPAVTKKANWALKWMNNSTSPFEQRLLAFICVEGIFFAGSFCAIYWMNSRGLLPGLSQSNQYISRDESLHCEFGIALYNLLPDSLNESVVHSIVKEAVDIEIEFITESLPVSLLGMNQMLMGQYIKFVADRWLTCLNYNKIYNVEQPFAFMELISLQGKSNFFEKRNVEYFRAGVGHTEADNQLTFDDDSDF